MQLNDPFSVSGKWFRWSEYCFVAGQVLPCDNAELIEYDPWEPFRRNAGKYRTVAQPYIALVDLAADLERARREGIEPTPFNEEQHDAWNGYLERALRHKKQHGDLTGMLAEFEAIQSAFPFGPQNRADQAIVEWCNQHGHLGLLPVLCTEIDLADEDGSKRRGASMRRFGGEWGPALNMTADDPMLAGSVAHGAEDTDSARFVYWSSFDGTTRLPLDYLRRFIRPGLWTAWSPTPNLGPRSSFWTCYAEPAEGIARAARGFAWSVLQLGKWKPEDAGDESRRNDVETANVSLNSLARASAPVFRFDPLRGRMDEERVSAGLLSSFALMALWDRSENRRTLPCQICHRYFVSDDPRAMYCSPRCRNTASSRRFRAKREAKKKR